MKQHKIIQYSKMTFSCTVVRKHFFKDKVYYLYVLDQSFIMVDTEYGQNPKYEVPYDLCTTLKWVIEKNTLSGFTIKYKNNDKDFHGHPKQISKLKEILGGYFFYDNFKNFYSPCQTLGEGTFGKVVKYQGVYGKKYFAVKAINKSKTMQKKEGLALLYNEITILKTIDHPNILKLREVYQDQSNFYLVTDFLEGQTLRQMLKKKSDTFKKYETYIIMQQILSGLVHLHQKQIIHRDMKLSNIMFCQPGSIAHLKIIDLGLSVFKGEQEVLFPGCGTVGYMAPEIANYNQNKVCYDEKSDVFSVGCIFFKLLTKKNIFSAKSTMQQNKECKISLDAYLGKGLESSPFELVKYMVKKNPEERISAEIALNLVVRLQTSKLTIDDQLIKKNKDTKTKRRKSNSDHLRRRSHNNSNDTLTKHDKSFEKHHDEQSQFMTYTTRQSRWSKK